MSVNPRLLQKKGREARPFKFEVIYRALAMPTAAVSAPAGVPTTAAAVR